MFICDNFESNFAKYVISQAMWYEPYQKCKVANNLTNTLPIVHHLKQPSGDLVKFAKYDAKYSNICLVFIDTN
jgi:hypothetical protein